MPDKKLSATSGPKLFEVIAKDGRRICLHEQWFYEHILARKVEIKQLTNPVQEIQRALTDAVEVRSPSYGPRRPVYVGPAMRRGFFRDYALHVVVQPVGADRGLVITVMMHLADDEQRGAPGLPEHKEP